MFQQKFLRKIRILNQLHPFLSALSLFSPFPPLFLPGRPEVAGRAPPARPDRLPTPGYAQTDSLQSVRLSHASPFPCAHAEDCRRSATTTTCRVVRLRLTLPSPWNRLDPSLEPRGVLILPSSTPSPRAEPLVPSLPGTASAARH